MREKLKIVICDEKKSDRTYIENIIRNYLVQKRVLFALQIFESGEHLCQKEIDLSQYDILFLDANMGKLNGIETAHQIRQKGWNIKIVLLSEIIDYAVDGYRIGAIRYIMKENMERELPECLEVVLSESRNSDRRMVFPMLGGKQTILLGKILYIESKLHKLYFKLAEGKPYMYGKLDELEEQLTACGFVRVHQSFLVNLEYVDKINNYQMYLTDGSILPVTKQRYSEVKEQFAKHFNCEMQ